MFNDHLKKFLKLYDCNNTELFDLILNCKKELKNELFDIYKQDVFIEPIKLETSIKIMNSGKSIKSRYVIGIHINEFKLYNENNITIILVSHKSSTLKICHNVIEL